MRVGVAKIMAVLSLLTFFAIFEFPDNSALNSELRESKLGN